MDWKKLKENLYPSCGKLLSRFNPITKIFSCGCGFSISELRFKQVVTKEVEDEIEKNYVRHHTDF